MRFFFDENTYTTDEILAGQINQKKLTQHQSDVVNVVKSWIGGNDSFLFQTSGSTGKPKKITLTRDQIEYSARETLHYLFEDKRPTTLLTCLDPKMIGGFQSIVRALIGESDLYVTEPSSNPLKHLVGQIDLVSLVPLQIEETLKSNVERFDSVKTVIIGGAPLDQDLGKTLVGISSTRFYESYGMTETASHIGLRKAGQEWFEKIGDIQLDLDDRNCLKIKGSCTSNQWIQTNDIVELKGSVFKWVGRADWTINSGGVKLQPEEIEAKIKEHFPDVQLGITWKSDRLLGQKIVLISDRSILGQFHKYMDLDKYEIPKEEIVVAELPRLDSGKLDRLSLQLLT